MRHAVARIPGRDIDIWFVHRISSDKGQTIDWLHDLAGPAEYDFRHHRKTGSCPFLQLHIASLCIICLSSLMILAAHNQYITRDRCRTAQTYIVIGIWGVPIEPFAD